MPPVTPAGPLMGRRGFFGRAGNLALGAAAAAVLPRCLDDSKPSGSLFPTDDFGTPPADPVLPGAPAVSAYALGGEVKPFGALRLPKSQFLAGFVVGPDGRLAATSTSVGDTMPHLFAGGLVTPGGVVFDLTQEVARRLGIPHLDAVQNAYNGNMLRAVVPWHDVQTNAWGWDLLYVMPPFMSIASSDPLDAAASQVSGMLLAGGTLVFVSSNLVGPNNFAPGTLHISDLTWDPRNPTSYPEGTFNTGGLNPNGLREVVIDGSTFLMVVNSGPIDTDGNSLGSGSILLFPSQEAGAQSSLIDAPGGLALSGQVSLIDTEDGPMVALPSAANDGKIHLVNLRTLRATGSFEQSATVITLPTIKGGKNLVAFAEFSPDGRYLAAANQNTGRMYVYDLLAGQFTTADGYLLDAEPGNHQEIAPTAAWLKGAGLLVGVGQGFQLIPTLAA